MFIFSTRPRSSLEPPWIVWKAWSRFAHLLGEPNPDTYRKIQPRLNARMVEFIASAPLALLATVDSEGFPTISPKGDGPGFIQVRDTSRLLIPERKGNKLAFSLDNLLAQPRAGLLFMVPGTPETLRIQGQCRVLHDPELCRALASATQDALLVIEFTVSQCYFHCAKAFLRSRTWQPDSWGPRQRISFGQELFGTGTDREQIVKEVDEAVNGRYQTDL